MTAGPTDRAAHWNAAWRRNAPHAVSWYEAEPTLSLSMIDACHLPAAARIIDIGGGTSELAGSLLVRGFNRVAVLDIAAPALEAARVRMGALAERVDWITADVTKWQPGHRYDLWHDRAVFHFLTDPADRARYVTALRAAVPSGGHVVIATFALDGPDRCSGLPVMRYDSRAIGEVVGTDFVLRDSCRHQHKTPAGLIQHFTYARFQRI